jgi:hypothetical protein
MNFNDIFKVYFVSGSSFIVLFKNGKNLFSNKFKINNDEEKLKNRLKYYINISNPMFISIKIKIKDSTTPMLGFFYHSLINTKVDNQSLIGKMN